MHLLTIQMHEAKLRSGVPVLEFLTFAHHLVGRKCLLHIHSLVVPKYRIRIRNFSVRMSVGHCFSPKFLLCV
jgi:hypothetical protein